MIRLQASSYEFVTESADQGSQAYWYLSKNRNRNFHRAKLLYVGTRWSTRLRTKAPFTLFSRIKPRRRTSPILEFVMAMSSCKFSCRHMYKSWVTNEIKIHFTDIFSTQNCPWPCATSAWWRNRRLLTSSTLNPSQITAALNECLNFDGITFNMDCIEGEFRDR